MGGKGGDGRGDRRGLVEGGGGVAFPRQPRPQGLGFGLFLTNFVWDRGGRRLALALLPRFLRQTTLNLVWEFFSSR